MIAWEYLIISGLLIIVISVTAAWLLSIWLPRSSGTPTTLETENMPLQVPATSFQIAQLRSDVKGICMTVKGLRVEIEALLVGACASEKEIASLKEALLQQQDAFDDHTWIYRGTK